jgi:hypothetical protein
MHARTRSGAAQGKEPLRITAEDLTEGLSACAEEDRKHAERNEDLLRQHFPQVDNVVELAQQQLKCVLMLDLARHFELAALLRANSDGPIAERVLVGLTFACVVRPLLSIRAAQGASIVRTRSAGDGEAGRVRGRARRRANAKVGAIALGGGWRSRAVQPSRIGRGARLDYQRAA